MSLMAQDLLLPHLTLCTSTCVHTNIHGKKIGISLAPKVKNPSNSNNHEKMRKTEQHYSSKSNVTPVNDVWL